MKITLSPITTQFGFQQAINERLKIIQDAFNNSVLFREEVEGEPNTMSGDLDMGGKDIINCQLISATDFKVGGIDITEGLTEIVQEVQEYSEEAEASATSAASSAESALSSSTSATASATSASASASSAETSATTATTKATEAASSASSASTSASSAATDAATASTKATEASASATSAASSASSAETSATTATTKASEASAYEASASESAISAANSAAIAQAYATPIGFIGEIVATFCSDTYTPEGCLPCDGTEYTKASFPSLWSNYLTGDAPNLLTCTYEEYTTSVTTYGSCAKFAVDSANEKFKVPTIPDGDVIAQASSDDEVGKSYNAGLPNITGTVAGTATDETNLGAFERGAVDGNLDAGPYTVYNWNFDASLSNDIYGNSDTVTPQQVRLRHFVVVAFGTQNDSQMDWSEWATSLSGKANNDLANVTAPTQAFKDMSVGWGLPDWSAGVTMTINTEYTADTPLFVYCYMVSQSESAGGHIELFLEVDGEEVARYRSFYYSGATGFIPINKGSTYKFVNVNNGSSATLIMYPTIGGDNA